MHSTAAALEGAAPSVVARRGAMPGDAAAVILQDGISRAEVSRHLIAVAAGHPGGGYLLERTLEGGWLCPCFNYC